MLKLFEILTLSYPTLSPKHSKIHLAGWNGEDDPLDEYLAGRFEEWQRWQTKKNFERKFIISLIQLPQKDRWLFADCYKSKGCTQKDTLLYYQTSVISELSYLSGRLVVDFERKGRQSYRIGENWCEKLHIAELYPQKLMVGEFPGYKNTLILKSKLDIIITQNIPSWKSALQNVSGIYLITDTNTGLHYVGSATGQGGIWERWRAYSMTGHGGNKALKVLLGNLDKNYSDNFQFSVLEIADTHTGIEDILERESYWKQVLCSREHGHNQN